MLSLQRLSLAVGEGARGAGCGGGSLPIPSTLTYSCTQTHFTPFLFLFLSSQTRPDKVSVPLPLLLSPSLPPLYLFQSLLSPLLFSFPPPFLPPFSGHLLSLQWHLPPQPCPAPPMSTLVRTHALPFMLCFYCNFSMFKSTNTLCYNCLVFRTATCCTGL